MEYAKFVDTDTIKRPPRKLVTPQLIAFNFDKNETLLAEQGYKPLLYEEQTEPRQGYTKKPTYKDYGDYIQVHWVETEIEEEGID